MTRSRVANASLYILTLCDSIGGKVKPLKAPKKDKKDLDEDEVAFREKQKAGMIFNRITCITRCATDTGR